MNKVRGDVQLHSDPLCRVDPEVLRNHFTDALNKVSRGVPHALLVIHIERFTDIVSHGGDDAHKALLELVSSTLQQQAGDGILLVAADEDSRALVHDGQVWRDHIREILA